MKCILIESVPACASGNKRDVMFSHECQAVMVNSIWVERWYVMGRVMIKRVSSYRDTICFEDLAVARRHIHTWLPHADTAVDVVLDI